MKAKANPFLAVALAFASFVSTTAWAADRIKQNNTTDLNLAGSWDVLPTSSDVALFTNTYATTGALNTGALVTWQGIRIVDPGGNVVINNSTSGQEVALGTAGIDMSAATRNLNIQRLRVDASQTWNVANGRTFNLGSSSAVRSGVLTLGSGGPFTITKSGAGTVQLDTSNTAIGNVNWDIQGGVIRAIWNGSSAWGTGTITLGGGGMAAGTNFAGSVGNWTWSNNITLTNATSSFIDNQNISGSDRWLKLTGVISGGGNVEFRDTGSGFTNANFGHILSGTNTNTGTVTIAAGTEVRVGATTTADANTGNNGKLAADAALVVNNGTLSFSRLDSHTVANDISGSGSLRIGLSATVGTATTTQVVNLAGASTYSGVTTVLNGRLNLTGSLTSNISVQAGASISGQGSTTGTLSTAATSGIVLAGGATTTGLIANGVTIGGATTVSFFANLIAATSYDVFTYGAGGVSGLGNLATAWRGSFADDTLNKKVVFVSGASALRTWNTTTGSWDNTGTNNNWVEGDLKFYDGDSAVFGDIASNATVTLATAIAPGSVLVQHAANAYTFSGGSLTGAGGLTKSNAGTLIITNTNSNSGATTVSGGVLDVGNGGTTGALGSGAINISAGAEVLFHRSNNFTVSNVISGDGLATKKGAGRMTVNGNNSGGEVNWNFAGTGNGDIGFQNANAIGGTGSTITLAASATGSVFLASTGNTENVGISLGSGSTFTWNGSTGNTNTVSGVISGSGNFTKVSGEVLILTGANAFSGNTTVSAGSLQIGGAGVLGNGNYAGSISNAGIFSFNSSSDQMLSGTISGGGRLDKASTGSLTLSGSNNYSGGTELLGGRLQVNALSGIGSNYLAVKNGATFVYQGTGSETTSRSLFMDLGAANIQVTNATASLTWNDAAAKNGAFTKSGSGSLTLGGAISGAGSVTVNGGVLTLNAVNSYTGTTTLTSGRLVVNGSVSGTTVIVDSGASLAGSGVLTNATISGAGSINPGNSPGILTASAVNPGAGLDFNFEFTVANSMPTWNAPSTSGNDVMRLTGSVPLTTALEAGNIISIYLNVGSLAEGDVFTGGFYADQGGDFSSALASATFQYLLADGGGAINYNGTSYSVYSGPLSFDVDTIAQSANFGGGTINGTTMQITAIPEPGVVSLWSVLTGICLLRRRKDG